MTLKWLYKKQKFWQKIAEHVQNEQNAQMCQKCAFLAIFKFFQRFFCTFFKKNALFSSVFAEKSWNFEWEGGDCRASKLWEREGLNFGVNGGGGGSATPAFAHIYYRGFGKFLEFCSGPSFWNPTGVEPRKWRKRRQTRTPFLGRGRTKFVTRGKYRGEYKKTTSPMANTRQ